MLNVGDRVMLEAPIWAPAPTKLGRVIQVTSSYSVNIGRDLGTVSVEWDDGTIERGFTRTGGTLRKINDNGQLNLQ